MVLGWWHVHALFSQFWYLLYFRNGSSVIRIIYVIDVTLFHNGSNCNKDYIYVIWRSLFHNGSICYKGLYKCDSMPLHFQKGDNGNWLITYAFSVTIVFLISNYWIPLMVVCYRKGILALFSFQIKLIVTKFLVHCYPFPPSVGFHCNASSWCMYIWQQRSRSLPRNSLNSKFCFGY